MGDTLIYTSSGLITHSPKRLVLITCVALLSVTLWASTAAASQELINNGGFESSNLTGWTNNHSDAVNTYTLGNDPRPPHTGTYSVRIGTPTGPGMISQTVRIPPKSNAKFTAWYRLEKGSSLIISLKTNNGSIIQQWSENNASPWTSVAYELDLKYAGQEVTVEFTGGGDEEVLTQNYYCGDSLSEYVYPCELITIKDYYALVDDVSLTSEVVAYQSDVFIRGLPEELSTRIYVDSTQAATVGDSHPKSWVFYLGEIHRISADQYVYKDNGTRFYCPSETMAVSSDGEVTFSYQKQYYLSIESAYGQVSGGGWYDEGSKASISPGGGMPIPGLLGALGTRYVFQKWVGAPTGVKGEITMDGPKMITAIWVADYSITLGIVAIAATGSAATFLLLRHRRVMSKS